MSQGLPDLPKVALVVLAAGQSSRMGRPKQLLEIGGQPMIRLVARAAIASGCDPVLVVRGAHDISPAISDLPVEIVENNFWQQGMGSSIRCGIKALSAYDTQGAILTLADLPLVKAETFRQMRELWRAIPNSIVAAKYAGTLGVPALFSESFYPELLNMPVEQGCKSVIYKNLEVVTQFLCPEAEVDIDRPEDFQALARHFQHF